MLFAFLTFSSYSVAKIQADKFINELTSLDPATLPQAQLLLTSLALVPSWMVVLLIIVVVYMVLSIIFFGYPDYLVGMRDRKVAGKLNPQRINWLTSGSVHSFAR
ncbi:hypothetical protein MDMS009_647 [Methylophaga thiooxydans DMS010]|uniref:Uncharacterized protein n=1 Tax=Methylophaga thiooxydans DMS010 TaxID=637616 RepID=C0N3E2_9GAMM|nr:hypothetical protein MDMS009_647 [Methylophaga thiooxydans DMS010]